MSRACQHFDVAMILTPMLAYHSGCSVNFHTLLLIFIDVRRYGGCTVNTLKQLFLAPMWLSSLFRSPYKFQAISKSFLSGKTTVTSSLT